MKTEPALRSKPSPFLTGGLGRCPACGRGRLFDGFIRLARGCEVCELDYAFADAGDGPAVFVTLLGGGVVCAAALWVDAVYDPPLWAPLVIFPPLAVIVCLGLLRPLKGLLVALQFVNKAEQARWRK